MTSKYLLRLPSISSDMAIKVYTICQNRSFRKRGTILKQFLRRWISRKCTLILTLRSLIQRKFRLSVTRFAVISYGTTWTQICSPFFGCWVLITYMFQRTSIQIRSNGFRIASQSKQTIRSNKGNRSTIRRRLRSFKTSWRIIRRGKNSSISSYKIRRKHSISVRTTTMKSSPMFSLRSVYCPEFWLTQQRPYIVRNSFRFWSELGRSNTHSPFTSQKKSSISRWVTSSVRQNRKVRTWASSLNNYCCLSLIGTTKISIRPI